MVRLLFAAAAALTLAGPAAAQTPHRLVDALSCTPFEWAPIAGMSERGALIVPVRLDGRTHRFQLDTGAASSFVGAEEARRRGWASRDGRTARIGSVEAGGAKLGPLRMITLAAKDGGGTLGLSALKGRQVVLDYVGRRFCVAERLTAALEQRTRWTPASLRENKFFVPVQVGDQRLDRVFFDTGASMFPLIVESEAWRRLTGREGAGGAVQTMEVPAWGRRVVYAGAPMARTMQVAGVTIENPTVWFNTEDPAFFGKSVGGGAEGLIGNMPFWDGAVVLDLAGEVRFGVLR